MNPKPSFSTYNQIINIQLYPKLKQLLAYSLNDKKPPKQLFDEINYHYYMTYVKPKLAQALKDKNNTIRIYISPSYLIYDIPVFYKQYQITHVYTYIVGIDNDKLFVNRLYGTPDIDSMLIAIVNHNTELRLTDDSMMYKIMGYDLDLSYAEETTIEDIPPNQARNMRVQGDLVLRLGSLDDFRLSLFIGSREILEHITILVIDLINRIMLNYGLSSRIINNTIYLPSTAPRNNDLAYLSKVAKLLHKELTEILGEEEIELRADEHHTFYDIIIKSTYNCTAWCIVEGGGYGNKYNHIRITVNCDQALHEPRGLYREILNEIIEAIKNTPPSTFEFNIGNHFIRLTNSISLSFNYRPSKQPITLNEHIINVRNPLSFIVTPDTTLELQHPEHGIKTVKFKDNYIITFAHVNTHRNYTSERNRVILKTLKL
jgi:hypothetical protein